MLDVLLGSLTGLIGNAFTTWFKFKNAKLEYDHKEKMVKLNTDAMIQKSQMQIDITKTQTEGKIEIADAEAFDTSQKTGSKQLFHEKWIDMIMAAGEDKKWTGWIYNIFGTLIAAAFAFVDWLNTLMRPALTIYLVSSSSYITYLAWKIMDGAGIETLTSAQAVGIFNQVTSTMIYLAVSAVTWWFGDRTMSKYLQQKDARRDRISSKPKKGSEKPRGGGDVDI